MSDTTQYAPHRVLASALVAVGIQRRIAEERLRATGVEVTQLIARQVTLTRFVREATDELPQCNGCKTCCDPIDKPLLRGTCEQCHFDDNREKEKAE